MKKYLNILFLINLLVSTTISYAQEVYKVGATANELPTSFKDEYGKFIGLEIDLMNRIAELEGFKVEFIQAKRLELFPGIENKTFDILLSSTSYTDERNQKYALSEPYLINLPSIMTTAKHKNIKNLEDLAPLAVGVMSSSIHQQDLESVNTKEVKEYDEIFPSFRALAQGKVDAILNDNFALEYLSLSYRDFNLGFQVTPYQTEDVPTAKLVMVMSKDNAGLQEKINRGIRKLVNNGELKTLEEKWLNFKAEN